MSAPEWMTRAACAGLDPDIMFPRGPKDSATIRTAQSYCATCPVIDACAEYAESLPELEGVWAGQYRNRRRPPGRPRSDAPRRQRVDA